MYQLTLLYLALGTAIWLTLSGSDSLLVRGYREGQYDAYIVIAISLVAILLWPRLAFAMATGK